MRPLFRLLAVLVMSTAVAACSDDAAPDEAPSHAGGDTGGVDSSGWGGEGSGGGRPWEGADAWSGADTTADSSAWESDASSPPWGERDAGSAADAAAADTGGSAPDSGPVEPDEPIGNTNISFGGTQDFGFFRRQLDANTVPALGSFEASGFFAEHHTALPVPDCGERVCLQPMLAVLTNLFNGNQCTMLQIGLNSPIVANPDRRPPLTLTVVVDVSGSMNTDGKIEYVRSGLEQLVDAMTDGDQLAIVTYDSDVRTVLPMTPVLRRRAEMRRVVDALFADGGTNLYGGLEEGYRVAAAAYDSGRQNRVIMLSDGQPTAGITDADSILRMSAAYNSDGIGLTTIGLGSDFNYALMRDLAQTGDGNFYFVESVGAVTEVFADEISYFTVPVAFDLELSLESGEDFTVSAVHGTSRWERSSRGGSLRIPSVFLAHRASHDDVTPDGGRRGGGSALVVELMPRRMTGAWDEPSQVGTVLLRFREPGTDRTVEQRVDVAYPYAPFHFLSTGFFNAAQSRIDIVQKSFVMLNLYVGMELAIEAFHRSGSAAVQIAELRNLLEAVRDYNEEIADVDIEYDIALVEQLIDVLVANGAIPRPPAPIEDPWPCD